MPGRGAFRSRHRAAGVPARASGQLRAEIEALLPLARIDRDRSDAWRDHLGRERQRIRDGEPARAWRLLQPRIDALLAIREPSRQEAEALALMAREVVARAAGLDGAGPALRLGSDLLRGARCESAIDGRCPTPALPGWAPEDRLAFRLTGFRRATLTLQLSISGNM